MLGSQTSGKLMTTQYWITGTSGDWSTAADWQSGAVPNSTDDTVINNSTAVTVNGTAVANSLTLDAAILTLGGTLTLGTSLTVDDTAQLQLIGGTLSAQSITSDNIGVISGYGTVSGAVSGRVDIIANGGTLTVQGSLAAGNLTVDSGATLELSNGTADPVYFNGSLSTLKLDAPTAFTGGVVNFALGGTIDLAGITASSATFSGVSLTINESNGQQLTYNVGGSVGAGTVAVASDNHGGTLVSWIPATNPVTFSGATATYYETYNGDWLPSQMIDGIISTKGNGWAIWNNQTQQTQSETALLTLATPVAAGPETWTITIYQDSLGGGGGAHLLGDFSLGYTTDPSPNLSSTSIHFTITAATSLNGSTLTSLGNGQLLDNGLLPFTDVYTITLTSDSPDPITGIFLDAIKDPTNGLPAGGPGRWYGNSGDLVGQGNFVVSELTADVSAGINAPTVASISATTDNKATDVNAGHLVTIMVYTSEVVNVTGTPTLQLNDNEVAIYTKGSGTNTLTFTYAVQSGDNVADLQVTGLNLPSGATIQDAAGNNLSGSVMGDLGIQIDTTPPAVTEGLAHDTGWSSTDKVTSNDALTGSGDPNAVVTLTEGTATLGTATANASGIWTFTPSALADGVHTIVASETDAAGNTGTASFTFTLDTTAPVPVITSEVLSKSGAVTLTGTTAEANDAIAVYDGTKLLGTTTTASNGTWTFPTGTISNVVHTYTATATDVAGNIGPSSNEAILGSTNADTLVGTSGNDIIIGNGGNDTITGGLGADTLTGGSGKVKFVYNSSSDSTPSSHDTITDFNASRDIIDFTNIAGVNAHGGIATFEGKLTGSGNLTLNAHSVAYIEVNGNTEVLVNTTNTAETVTSANVSAANMEIVLVGIHLGLKSADFHHV